MRPEPGLHLVIGDLGEVLRSAEIRNAPRRFVQPPYLNRETLKDVTKSLSELVLDLLGPDGRVLDSFGWPWTAEAFFDRPPTKEHKGKKAGRFRSPTAETLRLLRVPVPGPAAFLLFSKSIAVFGRQRRPESVKRVGLTLYSRVSPVPHPPRLPDFARDLPLRPLPGRATLPRPH